MITLRFKQSNIISLGLLLLMVYGSAFSAVRAYTDDYLQEVNVLSVDGNFTLNIEIGSPPKLIVTGDKEAITQVKFGSTLSSISSRIPTYSLYIGMKKNAKIKSSRAIKIDVQLPLLLGLGVTGKGITHVNGLTGENFYFGANKASETTLSGKVDHVQIDALRGAVVDAANLKAKSALVSTAINKKTKIIINASDALTIAMDNGIIQYIGNPKITKQDMYGENNSIKQIEQQSITDKRD